MKRKKSEIIKSKVDLVKPILNEQNLMKVVLNGGKYELGDATIPFQIGFNQEVADLEPTHILVLDVVRTVFADNDSDNLFRLNCDSTSERTLFKIQPVHYLQLTRSGKHHLIFILFQGLSDKDYQYLLEKKFGSYENHLYLNTIEELGLDAQVAYCEAIINVPEEFFAKRPETKFDEAIWNWTNDWYKLNPTDQCEYRKRKIFAFTVKPIIWLLGFLLRFVMAIFMTVIPFIVRCFGFLCGHQPVSFFPNFKKTWWDFLILYPDIDIDDIFEGNYYFGDALKTEWHIKVRKSVDWYPYKTFFFFGKKIYTPISFFALVIYFVGFSLYADLLSGICFEQESLSLWGYTQRFGGIFLLSFTLSFFISSLLVPTISNKKSWTDKWNEEDVAGKERITQLFSFMTIILIGVAILIFLVSEIGLIKPTLPTTTSVATLIGMFIAILFLAKVSAKYVFKAKKVVPVVVRSKKLDRAQRKANWLKTEFDINNMPEKIDFKAMPEPSVPSHKLVIAFWRTKATVCKPYAKK